MKTETEFYLDKAGEDLGAAKKLLAIDLTGNAGRLAYLAAFQAARALIFERTGKVAKTHKGVHSEFARLTQDDARIDKELRPFLKQSFTLKQAADYEVGPAAIVTAAQAAAAIETADRFIARVAAVIDAPAPPDDPA